MAPTGVRRAVPDTNVLLAATDEEGVGHHQARAVLDGWPSRGVSLYTSDQLLREYLAVATRPVNSNGLGLAQPAALANVRALRGRLRLMAENVKVVDRLGELLDTVACTGKQVHDANVVATMLVQGVDTLVTANVEDFQRFEQHARIVPLREAPAG